MCIDINPMTTTFEANFYNVEAIEDRVVTPDGRVTGLGRFKNRNVKIIVLEEDPVLGDDPACNLRSWTNPTYNMGVDIHPHTNVSGASSGDVQMDNIDMNGAQGAAQTPH